MLARRGAGWYAGAVLFLLLAIAIAWLFFGGGRRQFIAANSSSFSVEYARVQARAHHDAGVLVLGNSTAAEDFDTNWFNAHADVKAVNLGVSSGHLYLFERMLAVAQVEKMRPRAIIVVLTPDLLSLHAHFDFLLNDLTMLRNVADASDVRRLAHHTNDPLKYVRYAAPVALRLPLYRADIRDFITRPRDRLAEAQHLRDWFQSFNAKTPARELDTLFSVCRIGPLRNLKSAIERLKQEGQTALIADYARVRAGFEGRAGQPLAVDAFEAERFRRVLQILSTAAPVWLAFAPYYDPDYEQYSAAYRRDFETTVRRVAAQNPKVNFIPDIAPECSLFADTVHLNHLGAERFTQNLLISLGNLKASALPL